MLYCRILANNQEPVTNPQVHKLVSFSKTLLVCFQKVAVGDPNILPALQTTVGNFTLHCQLGMYYFFFFLLIHGKHYYCFGHICN
jgi:hypothetical protein